MDNMHWDFQATQDTLLYILANQGRQLHCPEHPQELAI